MSNREHQVGPKKRGKKLQRTRYYERKHKTRWTDPGDIIPGIPGEKSYRFRKGSNCAHKRKIMSLS